ncbi:MAG TPA: 5'-3' exonuclease H3TH domain-containing protein, partial [Ilumatobacteraceae bacterium]|nr:5'-3' exonuclease H3TH domain-containing protein [Ilumatobacteraceae bacterium]
MKLLLLDGNSLTYRAFYALPTDMATASGQVTNAVFGFTSMFAYLMKEQHPDGVMVAFDRPEPTFRHDANPLYKAQREAAPDILRQQMGLVREVLAALRVHVVDLAGWEADDILATVAEKAKAEGHEVIIVTGDRDTYQLVDDPCVRVLYNRRGVSDYALYDEAGIKEKTGVTPAQYPEYAALRGDPSDNLDGVPGVGEKTAAKLINAYGGLDGIFANVDAQTPKLRASLAEHEERVRSNAALMVLLRNAPIEIDFASLTVEPDVAEARRLFDFLEFRALTDRVFESIGTPATQHAPTEAQVLEAEIVDLTDVAAAVATITALDHLDVAVSWSGEPGRSDLIGLSAVTNVEACDVVWIPADVVADPAVLAAIAAHRGLRGHNVKALMRWALEHGASIAGLQLDVAIAAYLIDPADVRYALADLLRRYTPYQLPATDAAAAGQLEFSDDRSDDRRVAGRDALAVAHLASAVESALDK